MKASYIFWGKVKKGQRRGKSLGFPTANVTLHKKIPEGIYASIVSLRGGTTKQSRKMPFKAATFIGSAKTFGEKDYKAECYILDFNKNIYGKWVSIYLLKKIRGNKKFNSEKELTVQMNTDIKQVRDFLTENILK